MWRGPDPINDNGEPIRLFHPIPYGKKPDTNDLRSSFVGGDVESSLECTLCQEPQLHLAQIFLPKQRGGASNSDKTLQVFACSRASCIDSLFTDGKLSHGGGNGVVCCRRLNPGDEPKQKPTEPVKKVAIDDWGVDDTDNTGNIDDLEAKLAAIETTTPTLSKPATHKPPKPNNNNRKTKAYALAQSQEPGAVAVDDEDDVGLSSSDKKIQEMLSRYMEEEEDTDILAALQGTVASGGGEGIREKDERLSAEDRALLTFTDRLKRYPQQVIRYAPGGQPLWSIPVVDGKVPKDQRDLHTQVRPIPPCPQCGSARLFQLQILPSILSTLQVDSRAESLKDAYDGMDFGNIAVYTCDCDDAFVVVQRSLDELPTAPIDSKEDVLIDENAQFDEDDDDFDD